MRSKAAIHPAEAPLRTYALGFPESREDFPWGESAFKVKDKVFLFMYVHALGIKLSVKLPRSSARALDQSFAEPTGYGLGKSGWVTCSFERDERVPLELLREWIDESYRAVAPKKLVARLDAPGADPGSVAERKPAARPKRTARRPAPARVPRKRT